MAVEAYILANVSAGALATSLGKLKALPNVKSAVAITGPYDLVAIVEAEDTNAIGRLVAKDIQSIEGITRTLTSIVIEV
jgi:DNA-binding Lrp family transcriptional regulator